MSHAPPPPPPGQHAGPWLPPTSPAVTPDVPNPTSFPAPGLVLEQDRPRRSTTPWLVLVAAIVGVVVALGVVAALRGSSDDVAVEQADVSDGAIELPGAGSYSLSAAAAQAADATTFEYDVSVTAGIVGSIEMTGQVDSVAGLMTVRMDAGAILGAGDVGAIEMIIDTENQVAYLSAEMLGMAGLTDAAWVEFDLGELAAQTGEDIGQFTDGLGANPLDAATLFELADPDDVTEVGAEDIDGVATVHYRVAVDLADALDANPQLRDQFDAEFMSDDLPDEIVYDVWVTEANQLRRLGFAIDVVGESFSMEMNVRSVGQPLDIELPADTDVVDMFDLMGS